MGLGAWGAACWRGVLEAERADAMCDGEGVALARVRENAGFVGNLRNVQLKKGDHSAWVELHIEQGPLLERDEVDIGVVTGIAAPASYRIWIEGVGGHAGALLMPDRRDALCAAAEMVLAVEGAALATGEVDTVATVGTVEVYPGAVNSVPSRVDLELDVRDTDPERRETVMRSVRSAAAEVEVRRGVRIGFEEVNADAPAACDAGMVRVVEEACGRHGFSHRRMVSRAYHDSLFMARISPIGMIFVPCRKGVSHRPDEFATVEGMRRGVQVLAETLRSLSA